MLATQMSTKGQIVLPKPIRDRLRLSPGTRFLIEADDQRIILTPIKTTLLQRLYGKYSGEALLDGLEQEHAEEIRTDMDT